MGVEVPEKQWSNLVMIFCKDRIAFHCNAPRHQTLGLAVHIFTGLGDGGKSPLTFPIDASLGWVRDTAEYRSEHRVPWSYLSNSLKSLK